MAKEIPHCGINHNVIAQGTKVVGTITTENDIRIDGELEGDIVCEGKIIIGQQGAIKGNVNCSNAEIMGKVDGKLEIKESLSLKSTSKILGQIKTKILSIEPEAIFSGTCEMGDKKLPESK